MKKTRLIKIILKRTGALKFLTTYIIIFAGVSIGVWIVEPNIKTPIDSVWYCFSVATTIGFGDITAVTILGRAMSIFLSICSILIIAVVPGIITSYYIESTKLKEKESIAKFLDDLEHLHAYRSDCVSYRMVGDHLLPANPTGHVNNIRTYTMGVLAVAQMGRCMGEVAYKVSDSTFLWCNALLRRLLCATVIRHCTVHTGRKPDGNHSKRTDNGGLLAKQLLLRRLLDGGKYRGTEMPKPRAGLGSMDDT